MSFLIIPVAILSLAFFLIEFWLPGAITFTAAAITFCQSIFERCADSLPLAKAAIIWPGAALFLAGFLFASMKSIRNFIKAEQSARGLPVKKAGEIRVIESDTRAAFTYGMLRPKIFITRGLMKNLSKEELRAVFLHELKHKRAFDPLRFAVLSFLKDMFFYVPAIKHIAAMLLFKGELEADDAAGKDARLTLAGALVKAAQWNNGLSFRPQFAEKNSIAKRVKRLIDNEPVKFKPMPLKAAFASAFMLLFLFASFSLPVFAAEEKKCELSHCENHMDTSGEKCKTHCGI